MGNKGKIMDGSFRKLDVDDLITIILLSKGKTITEISKALYLTMPAIYPKITKIKDAYPELKDFRTGKGKTHLKRIAKKADAALTILSKGLNGVA